MKVTVTLRNLPRSPKKVRLLTRSIAGRPVEEARSILKFAPRQGSKDILKLLESGVRILSDRKGSVEQLQVASAVTNQGIKLKRFLPGPKGRSFPIHHRFSHISLTLTDENSTHQTAKTVSTDRLPNKQSKNQ